MTLMVEAVVWFCQRIDVDSEFVYHAIVHLLADEVLR
jgi:hypothetical protein